MRKKSTKCTTVLLIFWGNKISAACILQHHYYCYYCQQQTSGNWNIMPVPVCLSNGISSSLDKRRTSKKRDSQTVTKSLMIHKMELGTHYPASMKRNVLMHDTRTNYNSIALLMANSDSISNLASGLKVYATETKKYKAQITSKAIV